MILQSLAQYYNRLVADPGIKIPSYGFTEQKVYFCLVLDPDGSLVQVEDLRQGGGKKPRPLMMDAPFLPGRTSGIKTFFLCDNTGYVLGWDGKGKTLDKFQAFKDLHHELLGDTDDEDLKTLLRFIDSWVPERCAKLKYWEDMAGYNVVFRLDGQLRYLHQYPEAIEKWQKYSWDMLTKTQGMCLVSGEDGIISQLHWPIKGVRKAQPTGATIVSFNAKAYESYSKDQCYNAPVREDCAFAYVTALNRLLAFEGRQKIQLGDSTTVFWTEKPSPAEELLPQLLAAESMDDKSRAHDTGVMLKLRGILEALRDGKYPPDLGDPSVKFFILGLSPNNSRLAVRLWSVSSVGELAERAGQHFEDFALERESNRDPEFPSLYRILNEPFTRRWKENNKDRYQLMDEYSSALSASLARSVFTGVCYPRTLLSLTLGRIRADGEINYLRIAIIKSFITRYRRLNNQPMEVGMTLNSDSNDIGYLLGRLFAVLEKTQKDAVGKDINATIKDRYFGSASATPRAVFPQLLRMSQHHIKKAEYGKRNERMVEEILQHIESFPAHFNLDQQGMFALGYYHQRPAMYKKIQ